MLLADMTALAAPAKSTRSAHAVYCGGPLDGRDETLESPMGGLPLVVVSGWPDADQSGFGVYELARLADGVGYYEWHPSRQRLPGRAEASPAKGRTRSGPDAVVRRVER